MTLTDTEREQQALDWVRRIADPLFSGWDEHLQWLEADSRNAEAFDRISLDMEMATEGLPAAGAVPASPVANDNEEPSRRRWSLGMSVGGLVAAGFVALLLWPHHPASQGPRFITTMPGTSRDIALADGTKIALNGGSRLRIDDDRSLALIDGEGYFEVVHHADRPFRLQAGSRSIQDVGTSFDVSVAPQSMCVSVREGAVAIDPGGGNVQLTAGQEARIGAGGDIVRTTAAQNHAIGGWREGRLVYQEASWAEVAIDLNRALGVEVSLAPDMATRRFTGVIMLDRDRARTIRRLADVAGVSATPEGQGWRLARR
jgi:transmembrane sensor